MATLDSFKTSVSHLKNTIQITRAHAASTMRCIWAIGGGVFRYAIKIPKEILTNTVILGIRHHLRDVDQGLQ